MYEIKLSALDGGNLLGFLAALGTFRVLAGRAKSGAVTHMRWRLERKWVPILSSGNSFTVDALLDALAGRVTSDRRTTMNPTSAEDGALSNANAAFVEDPLDRPLSDFRSLLLRAAHNREARHVADFLTALGTDCFPEIGTRDLPSTTALRAIGAGNNEGFLGYMRTLHVKTRREHLSNALLADWDYTDPPPCMRWDPNEYRPHALRGKDPAKDRKQTNVRGANRLAVEALPLFPTAPSARRLRTVGFQDRNRETEITWPIWDEPIDIGTLQSLLAMSELQEDEPGANRKSLAARGIVQVFRAKRFTEGKYRNFSPARMLL